MKFELFQLFLSKPLPIYARLPRFYVKKLLKCNRYRFPKNVNKTLGIILYFPLGVILVILRVFIAFNAIFLTIILSNYPYIRR